MIASVKSVYNGSSMCTHQPKQSIYYIDNLVLLCKTLLAQRRAFHCIVERVGYCTLLLTSIEVYLLVWHLGLRPQWPRLEDAPRSRLSSRVGHPLHVHMTHAHVSHVYDKANLEACSGRSMCIRVHLLMHMSRHTCCGTCTCFKGRDQEF